MPTKLQIYSELAEITSRRLTNSTENWTSFLTTAARLYKYPYHDQLMIYAQRPDAAACADFETWNKRMGRYVRRGSKGIALIDTNGDMPKLRYVFDVSDTGAREKSRVNPFRCSNGMVFLAVVHSIGELPESEMQEIGMFDELPENLTYPQTSPVLYREAEKLLKSLEKK